MKTQNPHSLMYVLMKTHCTLLGLLFFDRCFKTLFPVHLELKDASMEDTIVEEHLLAAIVDRAAQVRRAI